MQAQRLNITLQYELARDFRSAIPVKKRSSFIAKVIKGELTKKTHQKELTKALKANYGYYKKVGKEIEEDFKYADAEVLERLS